MSEERNEILEQAAAADAVTETADAVVDTAGTASEAVSYTHLDVYKRQVYDGAGHGIKAAEASDAKGTTIEYSTDGESWSGTIPQFTEYREEGYPVHVRAKNDNYSNVAEADVVFRITKRPIKVAAGILETEYDGSEKAVTEFTYTVSNKENTAGALKDHKVSAVLKNNTRTEAGEQTVSVEENSVRILSGEADVTKNYAVSLEDGKLTVNQKGGLKVTVDAESLSHVYDGAGHGIKAAERCV